MTIDEAIEKFKFIANSDTPCPRYCMLICDKCVDESKQLAEWLEELKALRENQKMFAQGLLQEEACKVQQAFQCGYNKAIYDFAERLKSEYERYDIDYVFENSDIAYTEACYIFEQYIEQISEQLKEGVENE